LFKKIENLRVFLTKLLRQLSVLTFIVYPVFQTLNLKIQLTPLMGDTMAVFGSNCRIIVPLNFKNATVFFLTWFCLNRHFILRKMCFFY